MNQGKTSQITGEVLSAGTASFVTGEGETVAFGRVQMLTKQPDSPFYDLHNLKVGRDKFGVLPAINEQKGKVISIALTDRTFDGKTNSYFEAVVPAGKQAA